MNTTHFKVADLKSVEFVRICNIILNISSIVLYIKFHGITYRSMVYFKRLQSSISCFRVSCAMLVVGVTYQPDLYDPKPVFQMGLLPDT